MVQVFPIAGGGRVGEMTGATGNPVPVRVPGFAQNQNEEETMIARIRRNVGIAVVGLALTSATPARAESVTYEFSTTVTQVFGPVETLFGRTFVRGDLLSGRVIVDPASIGPDLDARSGNGEFVVGTGRVVFDVPSGFSMETGPVERFHAVTENNAPGAGLDFFRFDLFDQTGGSFFNALLVTWVDPAGRKLSSTSVPANVAGFGQTEVRFDRFGAPSLTLYGDSPVPVPEPATGLMMAGLAAVYRRARRTRSLTAPL
jgi:hypothetical protein